MHTIQHKIGDEVVIKLYQEDYEFGNKFLHTLDGSVGVVCAVQDELYFQGRTRVHDLQPGVYHKKGSVSVLLPDGRIADSVTYKIFLRDSDELHRRQELASKQAVADMFTRLGALPPTPFWEEDEVIVTNQDSHNRFLVHEINYAYLHPQELNARRKIYLLRNKLYQASRVSANESILELVYRGNVWKYYHNEPLSFNNDTEETEFYQSIGVPIIHINL